MALVLLASACGASTPPASGQARADEGATAPLVRRPSSAAGGSAPDDAAAPEAPAVTENAPSPPVGRALLEHPEALRRFFEALARLDDGTATSDVRITHFGDSHTAADVLTGTVRRDLVARFGDGGRGFVALGKPWKFYNQDGVRVGSHDFVPERGHLHHGKFVGDGLYGLDGVSVEASKKGARAFTDVSVPVSRIEVSYLEQPSGGSFELYVDGAPAARVSTRAHAKGSGFRVVDVAEGQHQIEARAEGDGDVRLFGVALDRATNGLTLDALGINGARVTTVLAWDEGHFKEQLAHRNPDLVVLAYGTNESGDATPAATYERQVVDLLGRVARGAPRAACLLLGPPDRAIRSPQGWVTSPKLLEIIESQKRVASAAGCAFYDQMQAMGGVGAMAAWAAESPPRAARDRVHLTRDGYERVGEVFAADLLRAYDAWRAETGKPKLPPRPASPPPAPPAVALGR